MDNDKPISARRQELRDRLTHPEAYDAPPKFFPGFHGLTDENIELLRSAEAAWHRHRRNSQKAHRLVSRVHWVAVGSIKGLFRSYRLILDEVLAGSRLSTTRIRGLQEPDENAPGRSADPQQDQAS